MKWRMVMLLSLLMLFGRPVPALAQCGEDPLNPCGPLPWKVSPAHGLSSPTPLPPPPTTVVTVTPTPTATAAGTASGPTPTLVAVTVDPSLLSTPAAGAQEAVSTLAPLFDLEISDAAGQSQGMLDIARNLGQQAGGIFGLLRGLQLLNLGSLGSVVSWAITAAGYALLIYILTSTTPILIWLIDMVLRILDAVANLIPF